MPKETISLPAAPAKRAAALSIALCDAIGALADDSPGDAREAVQEARERLNGAEAVAIRTALERCSWRVAPAASLLGYPRVSGLQKLLEEGRRHEAIGAEVTQHREEIGYSRGRPPAVAEEIPEGRNATPRRGRNAP